MSFLKHKIVNKYKLKELLLNDNEFIRMTAVDHLSRFFRSDADVAAAILDMVEIFGMQRPSMIRNDLYYLDMGSDEFDKMLNIINKQHHDIDSSYILSVLKDMSPNLLKEKLEMGNVPTKMQRLLKMTINEHLFLGKGGEEIFDKLVTYASKLPDDADDEALNLGFYMVKLLKNHKEIHGQVKEMFLSSDVEETYLELFLARLVGLFSIEDATPILCERIERYSVMAISYNELIRALGSIWTETTIKMIDKSVLGMKPRIRSAYVIALSNIPYQASEDVLSNMYDHEDDETVQYDIVMALCEIYSQKAIKMLEEMIEEEEYDPYKKNLGMLHERLEVYHRIKDRSIEEFQQHYEQLLQQKITKYISDAEK